MFFSKKERVSLSLILTLSWISGVCFFIFSKFIRVDGDFGLTLHPFQNKILRAHGLGAFLMMMTYGYIIGTHVKSMWKAKHGKKIGLTLVGLVGFMIISGYLLYYLSSDSIRTITGYIHFGVGLSLPFVIAWHVISGQKKRLKLKTTSKE